MSTADQNEDFMLESIDSVCSHSSEAAAQCKIITVELGDSLVSNHDNYI